MKVPLLRALRYARGWTSDSPPVRTDEVTVPGAHDEFPATVYRPLHDRPVPGWVLLHGITRPGRRHRSLVRFASALASSGAVVVVPEVSEWTQLNLRPDRTFPAIGAGLDYLARDPQALRPCGLVGFSFGSPQVIRAALDPELSESLGVVAAFGGYADLERALRFSFTGEHEWRGSTERIRPDPYGRWIFVANYLTRIEGFEDRGPVADALRDLAALAGDLQIDSWDPAMDPEKAKLRAALTAEDRELFDRFAPSTDREPIEAGVEVEAWVERLTRAARTHDPAIELPESPLRPRVPIHLIHGAADQLIPVSEGRRLGELLEGTGGSFEVTRLFSHSNQDGASGGRIRELREKLKFVRILNRILTGV